MKQKSSTEADLEARIGEALALAFPWLPAEALEYQTKFSLQVGRGTVTVGGEPVARIESRSDVLVSHNGKPLAVLELKRPGQALTESDEKQGLSYAALLHPHPPLVVVTNGSDTRILDSYSGLAWSPADPSETALAHLVSNAGELAASRLKEAVDVLLGSGSSVWVSAVRAATAIAVEERSGAWDELLRPFVPDFLIPRAATQKVLAALGGSRRLVLVEGAPLIGKSSVLRELASRTATDEEFAVLIVEAGEGGGILRAVAAVLSDALSWPIAAEEARHWLRQLSHRAGAGRTPTLVLAVDGVGPEHSEIRKEVDELTAGSYGAGVRIVLAVDDTVADRLVMDGRSESRIGRRAFRVPVVGLDDAEFSAAQGILWEHRFGITHGGRHSDELRIPWVLRSLAARLVCEPEHEDETLSGMLPPLIGVDLIGIARERLERYPQLRLRLWEVARAVLAESEDATRPVSLVLASLTTFFVRRDALRGVVADRDIEELAATGVLKLTFGPLDEALYVVRVPELLAAVMATLLADRLRDRTGEEPSELVNWLIKRAGTLLLGDIIAAQALLDLAVLQGSLPLGLLTELLRRPPRIETFRAGVQYAVPVGEFDAAELTVDRRGNLLDSGTRGQRLRIAAEDLGSDAPVYRNLQPWMILSHLAGIPFLAQRDGDVSSEEVSGRLDPLLLMEVAACPIPLRGPGREPGARMTRTHAVPNNVSIVYREEGIIEPITLSMLRFLGSTGPDAEGWIAEACATGSLPLLARLLIALTELKNDSRRSTWAAEVLRSRVLLALEGSGLLP